MPNGRTKHTESRNQPHILKSLLSNDEQVIKALYLANYRKIEALILSNNGTRQDAKDICQEAFIALWRRVKEGSFEMKNESSVEAFLYQVSKNKWMDYLKSSTYKKNVSYDELGENNLNGVSDEISSSEDEYELKLNKAKVAFKNLGSSCKSLLSKFYFEKRSMRMIAKELLLDDASARNKKYRCMQKLRELTLNVEK